MGWGEVESRFLKDSSSCERASESFLGEHRCEQGPEAKKTQAQKEAERFVPKRPVQPEILWEQINKGKRVACLLTNSADVT